MLVNLQARAAVDVGEAVRTDNPALTSASSNSILAAWPPRRPSSMLPHDSGAGTSTDGAIAPHSMVPTRETSQTGVRGQQCENDRN